MTDKLTPKSMKDQYDHQWNVFCKKNHDYGNSFEKSLDTFGLVAGVVRMNDKFERLVSLNDPSKDAQIASESLVDTLEDLSNYAAMAACWLKRKKERNWAKERLTAIKKEGVPVCKELEDAILKSVDDKIKSADIYSRDIPSNKIIGIQLVGRGNGKSASVQQAIKEALDKDAVGGDIKIEDVKDPKQFIRDVIKQITDTVVMKQNKGDHLKYMDISDNAGRMAKCIVDNNIGRNQYMGIISNYWHKHANIPVPLREFIYGVITRHIYYTEKSLNSDDLKWDHTGAKILAKGKPKSIDIESGEIIYKKPEFSGIHLLDPEKLELNLEVDRDKLFEISNALHPSNLPKSVKVNYCHKALYEFPDGIDTIASYLQQLSKEEAKKENDRVMLDMMLSRIEKGEVVRIVANGDGSFTTYFEKTDGPFDKIVDKEEEVFRTTADVKIDGQNGSSVTFTDGNGIFSFGNGVTARSLKGFTLGANPDEITKSLNEKRKDAGFDPVNGEEDDR